MTSPTCDRSALVEAMFDGRLGPSEQASTERHLKSCASCAELLRDLTSFQEMLRSTAGEVTPLEHQRARLALLRQTAGPSAATKRRPVALLIAALVTLPLAVWASTSSFSPLRIWKTAPAPTTQAAPATPAIGRKQAPIAPAPAALSPATEDNGSQHFELEPGRGSDLATSAAREAPSTPPLPTPSTPSHATRRFASAPMPSRPDRAPDESSEKPVAIASPAGSSQASQDFAEAMKTLSRGDFSAGAGKLEDFVAAHPRDPRVEDAVYLEAIALERAARVEDAKAAARRYVTTYPDGAHQVQARRIAGE